MRNKDIKMLEEAYDKTRYADVLSKIEKDYGAEFRLLNIGEKIQEGDRFFIDGSGKTYPATDIGTGIMSYSHYPHIRLVQINESSVTPEEVLNLIKELPDADKHIFNWKGTWNVTDEWLVGGFAGRAFEGDTPEEAAQQLIEFLDRHIGHDSITGREVTKSGWPDLDKVREYLQQLAYEYDPAGPDEYADEEEFDEELNEESIVR